MRNLNLLKNGLEMRVLLYKQQIGSNNNICIYVSIALSQYNVQLRLQISCPEKNEEKFILIRKVYYLRLR